MKKETKKMMRLRENEVKETIKNLAETIASGKWGAWQCSMGGLVALIELVNKLDLGNEFWAEIFDIKQAYFNQVKSVVMADPKDFFKR